MTALTLALLFLFRAAHAQDARALDGIAHVALRVSDVAKSREFYRTLGWEQAFEFGDDKGTATSYVKVNDRQFIELYRASNPADLPGLMHICFDAADLDRVAAAYEKAGLKPTDPRKARAGNLLFNLHDPEDHLLEYTQYLPGSLHMNERGKHLGEARIADRLVRLSQPVKDVASEISFFTGKLGFRDLGEHRLGVPGTSGEQIQVEQAAAMWKPRLVFAVPDVRRTAAELTKRGLAVEVSGTVAAIRDPDGAVLAFVPAR